MVPPRTMTCTSPAGTGALAAALARLARPGDVVILAGDLGAGKTRFAQGFAVGLGVDAPVTSPTFALLHRYDGGSMPLYHADVYRLDSLGELAELGLGELDDGVLLVEWGDAVATELGAHLLVELAVPDTMHHEESARTVTLRCVGRSWVERWPHIESLASRWDGE